MRKWLPLTLVVAAFAFSAAVFNRLPERMIMHWDIRGNPDGYGPRAVGAFLFPGILLLIWGILRAVPWLDPRRANIEQFRDTYEWLVLAVVGAMGLLHVAILGAALGWPLPVNAAVPVIIGLMFVVLGALMPRFKSNFFVGIRTPWTLSSDTVWTRTHRVGGLLMIVVGLLLVIAGILRSPYWVGVAIGGAVAVAVGVLGYSFVLWRSEQASK